MKPVVYSKKLACEKNIGWHRAGTDISYFANGILKSSRNPTTMYTLKFSYTFKYDNDQIWFAYNYPYTYSQLTNFLNDIESKRASFE